MPFAALSRLRLHYLQLEPRNVETPETEEFVMIHGLAAHMGFWYAGAAPAVAGLGRVTLFDLPGHGQSDMPASGYSADILSEILCELLDSLGLDRVHLVAHSFGGTVAIAFAIRWPRRVKSLTLADVRIRSVKIDKADWQLPKSWQAVMARAGVQLDKESDPGIEILTAFARLQVEYPGRAKQLQKALAGRGLNLGGVRTARKWLRLLESTTAYAEITGDQSLSVPDLRRIRQPVLAVFGEHSLAMSSARALKEHCPNCRLLIVPKAGHFFPLTRSAALVRPLRRMLLLQRRRIRDD